MLSNPQARPTMRVLRGLGDGWDVVSQLRAIQREDWESLHPLTELQHPILRKAADQFGRSKDEDGDRGTITCSGDLNLLEVRHGQWRAGVWTDPTSGVRWVVAVGLAKGGHQDADDFYEQLKAVIAGGSQDILPTDGDRALLKRESAAEALTNWEMAIQQMTTELMACAVEAPGAEVRVDVPTAKGDANFSQVSLTWIANDDEDYVTEEFVVGFPGLRRPSSNLAWTFKMRVLTTIAPPSQDWDIAGEYCSAMEEDGYAEAQIEHLNSANERGELLVGRPGSVSHYTHQDESPQVLCRSHTGCGSGLRAA